MTYDDALEVVGSFGRYQIQLFVVVFMSAIPNALLFTAIVFLHYVPEHKCSLQHIEEKLNTSSINSSYLSLLYPPGEEPNSTSHCTIYNISVDNLENLTSSDASNLSVIDCPSGWDYDNPFGIHSPMMEFKYLCDKSWYVPLMSSLFMFGMLASTITGPMSDRFGRRPVFLLFTLVQFVVTFLCSFANGAAVYGILMFLTGFSQMANYISAFILGAECTTPEKRNFISISSYIAFSLGYIIAPGLVFLLPDWRWLLRVNGLIGFLYIPLYWLMPESPRWLIAKRRYTEAEKILRSIAKCNKNVAQLPLLKIEMTKIIKEEQTKSNAADSQTKQLKEIVTSCRMVSIVFVSCLSFFTVNVIYTGFSMSVQALSGNMYINAVLLGAIELPGEVIAYLAVQYVSRPLSHGGLMIMTGLSCLSIGLSRNAMATFTLAASLFGKMCNLAVFYILYIHTTEVAPTLTRNSLMSVGTIVTGLGGILSPYFVHSVKLHGFFGPYLLIGALAVFSGLLTFLVLPETKGEPLPETVKEALNFKTFFSKCLIGSATKSNSQHSPIHAETEFQKLDVVE